MRPLYGRRPRNDAMRVQEVADAIGCCARSARTFVAAWFERQAVDPSVPRVFQARTGKRGRPAYYVDRKSFEAWKRGELARLAEELKRQRRAS